MARWRWQGSHRDDVILSGLPNIDIRKGFSHLGQLSLTQ